MVQSNDIADRVDEKLKFKFVDDLSVMLSSLLAEYDLNQHVTNDIVIDKHYVLSSSLKT